MLKLVGNTIGIIIAIAIGLLTSVGINWLLTPEWEKTYAKNFVFPVFPTFLQYEGITFDLELIDYKLHKEQLNSKAVAVKQEEKEYLHKRLAEASKMLDKSY